MYRSAIALENIENYSICVLTKSGIRRMTYAEDIELELVYVSNIPMIADGKSFTIQAGNLVRYASILVIPKLTVCN